MTRQVCFLPSPMGACFSASSFFRESDPLSPNKVCTHWLLLVRCLPSLTESHDQRSHIARSVTLISRKKPVMLRRKMFPRLNLKENRAVVLRLGRRFTELVYFRTIASRRASGSFLTISKPDYLLSIFFLALFLPLHGMQIFPKVNTTFLIFTKNIK